MLIIHLHQDGTSPLQVAIERHHTEIAQMLIDNGADKKKVVMTCLLMW